MRVRVLPILATIVLGVILLSGVVLADKNRTCRNDCKGTNGSDFLVGDASSNHISGLAGDDYVGGKEAGDTLLGGSDNDKVQGGSGKDNLKGGRGVDKVLGKRGYDVLLDQPEKGSFAQLSSQHGAYQVQAAGRPDRLLGGRGNDTIRARDGKRDIIRGGPGHDKAYVDPVDDVKDVEVKRCSGCPVAADDTKTVDENANATTIDVLNNDTDPDGGLKTIESVTQPANGTVAITNSGSDLTYTPDEGYWNYECGKGAVKPPDDFNYTLNGGSTATVDVIVKNLVSCNLG